MGEISTRSVLTIPALLCAAMLVVGAVTAHAAGINASGLLLSYVRTASAITLLSLLGFIFIRFAQLARRMGEHPVPAVVRAVRERLPLLILPALIFPLFLAGYTSSKLAIPHLVGFSWDRIWADADALIFGDDVWRYTHRIFGSEIMPIWEWFYAGAWGFTLGFAMALTAICLPPRRVAIFYTAMLGTWIIGGWLLAYGFSASGPVFAHLFDPALADRFAPLREALSTSLSPDGPIRRTQAYLTQATESGVALDGAGISAMPSMHLGAASIYVLLARGTRWVVPAILFWVIIFIGSGHFGYHYWIDGIVAAGVAWVCWQVAEFHFEGRHVRRQEPALSVT